MRFFTKKDKKDGEKKPRPGWQKALLAGAGALVVGSCDVPPAAPALPPAAPEQPGSSAEMPHNFQTQQIATNNCKPVSTLVNSRQIPSVSSVFTRMAEQPLSGAGVITLLGNSANRVEACTSPDLPDDDLIATYESTTRRLIVGTRNVRPVTVAHESFHAYQHLTGGFRGVSSNQLLSPGDRATGMLLIEATAAAYANVVLYEMKFTDPDYHRRHGRTYDYGMGPTFENTFNQSYAANEGLGEPERRRLALEAAGQAVVRALLNGQSSEWRTLYRPEAARYLTLPAQYAPRDSEGYLATRSAMYARIGQVAPGLQLIPAEFLGAGAEDAIRANHAAFRMTPPAPVATYSLRWRPPAA